MEAYPITAIEVKPRIRTEIEEEKLLELAESIHRLGLQHPPVVKKEGKALVLIAGERRLRAITKLHEQGLTVRFMNSTVPKDYIPVSYYTSIDATMAKEIELEENIRRVDLSWQDVAQATAELHELRKVTKPTQTLTDTAVEISGLLGSQVSPTQISNRLILAENLNRPAVAEAKNEKEAMKALRMELERTFMSAIGKQTHGLVDKKHRVELLDAVTGMQRCQDRFFDCIITDPPYGVNAEDFRVQTTTNIHQYQDDWKSIQPLLATFLNEARRVTKPQAHIYIFHDVQYFHLLKEMAREAGWDPWPRPLVWVKDTGHIPRPHHGPKRLYETILYCLKGDRAVNHLDGDVITCSNEKDRLHAAQKPVELYRNLLARSVYPGCYVLDPFCGSGTVFPAASALDCVAVGFDNDPAAVAMCVERMKNL
ncbi:MAG TPA: DNA modification methylase [Dissulfurispiraceae bacterium]|nr:DNA modification methylase [Dissulfurispiraceae bacterium]